MNWLHRKQRTGLRLFLRSEVNNSILALIRRRLASFIVYQSQFSHDWWRRVRGDLSRPCRVIYNGVDLASYSPDGPQARPVDHFRLLLVEGRLRQDNSQGLENALRLTEMLQQSYHLPVELVIAGDLSPQLQASLPGRAKGQVTWLGILNRDQLPPVYRSAHLLFSADLAAACPNAVIEALACGLPVVAFDTGALRELVNDEAGRVVPYGGDYWQLAPPNLPPLAQAAAGILAENEHFRQAARRRAAQDFGLDQMVEAYLQVLLG
jgi:glycosyltransferase involved in cell wall biosynthesis